MYEDSYLDSYYEDQYDLGDNDPYYDHMERDCDEEYEPDYDGQPDEAQEWHDFDPDC